MPLAWWRIEELKRLIFQPLPSSVGWSSLWIAVRQFFAGRDLKPAQNAL
jgi:hypothetical protein